MLATLTDSTKVNLLTSTTIRGHIRQHITTRNLTAQTRSIPGRTYAHLLIDHDITHLYTNLPPLQYNQTKGLEEIPNYKMTWATTLQAHTDIL
jgi:hypothetical protein